jgi:hypothetical protein
MTRDDTIRMAREVWGDDSGKPWSKSALLHLERFAETLEAKVRKECAELCRAEANGRSPLAFDALHECADLMMKGYEE